VNVIWSNELVSWVTQSIRYAPIFQFGGHRDSKLSSFMNLRPILVFDVHLMEIQMCFWQNKWTIHIFHRIVVILFEHKANKQQRYSLNLRFSQRWFWRVLLCGPLELSWRFGGIHRLRNIGWFSPDYTTSWSRNSSVGIAMGYGLDGRASIPLRSKTFFFSPMRPERIWDPSNLLYKGYRR
jgi:hypothetical protein